MSDVAEQFSIAQEAAVRDSAALAAAMGLAQPRIYPVRPPNVAYPYLVIGEDQIIDDSDECQEGSEIFSTLHLWDKPEPPSNRRARAIEAVLRRLLNADLAIAGHETIEHAYEGVRFLTDPDGATHGVLTFRYLTIPISG